MNKYDLGVTQSKGYENTVLNQMPIKEQNILGKQLSVYGTEEKPLFLAKQVSEWLDHNKPSEMIDSVDEDEKLKATLSHSGQRREMWFLTEDGVYEVLMQSRKPIAKAFKKEVKKVLKDIRKHGMYARDEILDNPDLLIQVATRLKREREQRKQLEATVHAQAPKVLFADAVTASHTSILVGELAKLIQQNGVSMGQKRLFEWLRENGYLIKRKGTDYNMPTQRSMDLGIFEIKETVISHSDGHTSVYKTPKVTGKGQVYFINKFLDVA